MENIELEQLEQIAISFGSISSLDNSDSSNLECCADYCPNDIDCSPECSCDKWG